MKFRRVREPVRPGAARGRGLRHAAALLGCAVLGCTALAAGTAITAAAAASCGGTTTITCDFSYTGGSQTFVVPTGVTQLTITAYGAQGGRASDGTPGGLGGEAVTLLAVTPGETLVVNVGGEPAVAGTGGYNGGGAGGTGPGLLFGLTGGGGGGASDVRVGGTGLGNRKIVAGGGGGGGGSYLTTTPPEVCVGGVGGGVGGGGLTPTNCQFGGPVTLPTGGTQTAGGTGGSNSNVGGKGSLGQGGTGSNGTATGSGGGGGGGGGLYGGGGGATGFGQGQGGAGGSGSTPTGTGLSSGVHPGAGVVDITYAAPPAPPAPVATTTAASDESVVAAASAQQVQLRATVTSASGVDVGSVTFTVKEGTTVLGTPATAPVTAGVATASYLLPASVPAGTYTIEAAYSGSSGTLLASSDAAHSLTVSPIPTTATVSAAPAQPAAGQTVTLLAAIDPGTVPSTGTVAFDVGGVPAAGCDTVAVSNGQAVCVTRFPAPGTATVRATYADAGGIFAPSDASLVLTVRAPVATSASSGTGAGSTTAGSGSPTSTPGSSSASGARASGGGSGSASPPSGQVALAYTGSDAGASSVLGALLVVLGAALLFVRARAQKTLRSKAVDGRLTPNRHGPAIGYDGWYDVQGKDCRQPAPAPR